MSSKSRRATAADYEEMADSYEAEPPRLDEVTAFEVDPAVLVMGRPKGGRATGKSPVLPVRLPEGMRTEVRTRVAHLGEASSESELVRKALVEYFDNHPRTVAASVPLSTDD